MLETPQEQRKRDREAERNAGEGYKEYIERHAREWDERRAREWERLNEEIERARRERRGQ